MKNFGDSIQETSTTSGTGTVTLAGAVSGYTRFQDKFSTGEGNIGYLLEDGTAWEIGLGTLASTTTLSRDRVLSSSNGNAAITLSGGSTKVSAVVPAQLFTLMFGAATTFNLRNFV